VAGRVRSRSTRGRGGLDELSRDRRRAAARRARRARELGAFERELDAGRRELVDELDAGRELAAELGPELGHAGRRELAAELDAGRELVDGRELGGSHGADRSPRRAGGPELDELDELAAADELRAGPGAVSLRAGVPRMPRGVRLDDVRHNGA
jgi:hypothetical protein